MEADLIPGAGRMGTMAPAVSVRTDLSAIDLRRLAAATRHANQGRRLLSLAAVLDGMDRTTAARIGGMNRQTLRDWVHRFNAHGPDGLRDSWSKGNPPRLSADQKAALARLVESGPDRAVDGVVRWRRIDLQRVIGERFSVTYQERTVGKVSRRSASPTSAPAHAILVRTSRPSRCSSKLPHRPEGARGPHRQKQSGRNLVADAMRRTRQRERRASAAIGSLY